MGFNNAMKTTIEISDPLFHLTRQWAVKHKMSLKDMIETALKRFLQSPSEKSGAFKLRNMSFKGRGLVAGLGENDWNEMRSRAYEGRGG
ncbi:MAG: hypothetical protein IPJ69_01650 [Deltaproteobacteria bacterium]|nr:MAG: hypothetical protein IPJ69_01650 [Deltaproteobacteria bacterium]